MAPLKCGCHYAWNCTGYMKNCGNCPAIYSSDPTDLTFQNLQTKRRCISEANVSYVACNSFTANQAKKSLLFSEQDIEKIFLSVNTQIFKPTDKLVVRKQLEIEEDKFIILVGASYLSERRKGWSFLSETLTIFVFLFLVVVLLKVLVLSIGEFIDSR